LGVLVESEFLEELSPVDGVATEFLAIPNVFLEVDVANGLVAAGAGADFKVSIKPYNFYIS
jgi:hypothetical protein